MSKAALAVCPSANRALIAAREQKILSYAMIERMTSYPRHAQSEALTHIYRYCKEEELPLLNQLVVNEREGKPGRVSDEEEENLEAERNRIFIFNWLERPTPSVEDFEKAYAARKPKATSAV